MPAGTAANAAQTVAINYSCQQLRGLCCVNSAACYLYPQGGAQGSVAEFKEGTLACPSANQRCCSCYTIAQLKLHRNICIRREAPKAVIELENYGLPFSCPSTC
jgi:hypothetical protein